MIEDPMVEVAIMLEILSPSFGEVLRHVKSAARSSFHWNLHGWPCQMSAPGRITIHASTAKPIQHTQYRAVAHQGSTAPWLRS